MCVACSMRSPRASCFEATADELSRAVAAAVAVDMHQRATVPHGLA
jgi:hypothetical protein